MGGGPASSLLLALGAFANLGLFGWQQWSRPSPPDPCQAAERCVAAIERLVLAPEAACADTHCSAADRCEEAVRRYDFAFRVSFTVGLGSLLALLACCLCRRPRERSAVRAAEPTAKRAARPSERVVPVVEIVDSGSDAELQLASYVPKRRGR